MANSAVEMLRAGLRTASAVAFPHSASPQRQDLRPPTCRSIGLDIARSLDRVSQGDPDVSRCILEHTRKNLAPAAWPVEAPSTEDLVGAQCLASLKSYVTGPLALREDVGRGGGTRPKEAQQALHTIAAAVYSQDVTQNRNIPTAMAATGLTRDMWNKGGDLRARNAEKYGGGVSLGAERATRRDAVDLEWLYDWFHEKSPDVEPNKTVKWNYKRKKIFCAGKERMIKCRPKVLTTSVAEAVQNAMNSDEYLRSGVTVHPKNVAACICHCIKPAKREECACPTCTEFIEARRVCGGVRVGAISKLPASSLFPRRSPRTTRKGPTGTATRRRATARAGSIAATQQASSARSRRTTRSSRRTCAARRRRAARRSCRTRASRRSSIACAAASSGAAPPPGRRAGCMSRAR